MKLSYYRQLELQSVLCCWKLTWSRIYSQQSNVHVFGMNFCLLQCNAVQIILHSMLYWNFTFLLSNDILHLGNSRNPFRKKLLRNKLRTKYSKVITPQVLENNTIKPITVFIFSNLDLLKSKSFSSDVCATFFLNLKCWQVR